MARGDAERVTALLDAGWPPDLLAGDGMNAVQSDRPDAVRRLLDAGANPNATDHRGFTALHRAAEMGRAEITRTLLDAGADATVEALGHTPQSLAEGQGHSTIVEALRASGR